MNIPGEAFLFKILLASRFTMELHHPLLIEFAEHRDTILKLKEEDPEFLRQATEYHELDREVCLIPGMIRIRNQSITFSINP